MRPKATEPEHPAGCLVNIWQRPAAIRQIPVSSRSIHGPAFGSAMPTPNPMAMSIAPIPKAMEVIMAAPRYGSALAIAIPSAEIKSGETQALTTKADKTPNTNTALNFAATNFHATFLDS